MSGHSPSLGDLAAFLRRTLSLSIRDHMSASKVGWVFFDRGLIDAAAGLQSLTGEDLVGSLGQTHRYHRRVFFTPPWPEIYRTDPERQHGLDCAVAEYSRLLQVYPALGYEVVILPRTEVEKRADFLLSALTQGIGD